MKNSLFLTSFIVRKSNFNSKKNPCPHRDSNPDLLGERRLPNPLDHEDLDEKVTFFASFIVMKDQGSKKIGLALPLEQR